jgi:hypothetical protein
VVLGAPPIPGCVDRRTALQAKGCGNDLIGVESDVAKRLSRTEAHVPIPVF